MPQPKIHEIHEKTYGNFPEKVLQFGEGNFLRAFAEVIIETANRQGKFGGSVVIAQPIAEGRCEALAAQNCQYTVLTRGLENGKTLERAERISSVSRCLNPCMEYEKFLELAGSETLEIIISNTTEAGIAYREGDQPSDRPPASYPAKLAVFLHERWKYFTVGAITNRLRDNEKSLGNGGNPPRNGGLLILPVELIEANGDILRGIILRYAEEWGWEAEFNAWLQTDCCFANTLVDRIVTGFPGAEYEAIREKLGYEDVLLDTCEPFLFWAIECQEPWRSKFSAEQLGLDIVYTDDLRPYRERKVRILNGAHTVSVLAAYLSGCDTVSEMMGDAVLRRSIYRAVHEEIIPTIDMPREALEMFANAVFERFENPFIRHNLLDISLNSVSKYKARCLPSLLQFWETRNSLPPLLCFGLAALLAFYRGNPDEEGHYWGGEPPRRYKIRDEAPVLQTMWNAWAGESPCREILSNPALWGQDLSQIPGLPELIETYLHTIIKKGMRAALEGLLRRLTRIQPEDTVAVAPTDLEAGEQIEGLILAESIPAGHKVALCDIPAGADVLKYGQPIGRAAKAIRRGEWVHSHNLVTKLETGAAYTYQPILPAEDPHSPKGRTQGSPLQEDILYFSGYERGDGRAGVRNEIWVLPTVGCVNKTAERLCAEANRLYGGGCDGFFAYPHPYGCSQLGEDQANTQKLLAALARHPNAAGVLLLSLGCENNNLKSFLPHLGDYDKDRIRCLVTQESRDELAEGLAILENLAKRAAEQRRLKLPASRLVVGLKCGGSDGFSGLTANPLCGRLADLLTAQGASILLTEVPEMFGAEHLLMQRAQNAAVFADIVRMIEGSKANYTRHGLPVYENPSPGNKAGGITTLEEKSLGCVQKGGLSPVTDVLDYAEGCRKAGLSLLAGPGNDIVSCTNLTAAGAQVVLFTTGRGTPLGAPVPTVKISSNTDIFRKKPDWIDWDAGKLLDGASPEEEAEQLLQYLLQIASGEIQTKNEINGYREIAILKSGVTL